MICTNDQIMDTLELLSRRPQKVIDDIYAKMKGAEDSGVPIFSILNENDIENLKQAMKALSVFRLYMHCHIVTNC
jgi:argonaute-like protein implicated in RNA metabolism and viral defense